jgi:chlorophyll synthase
MGINSLPVLLGADRAARIACAIMALPQFVVIALLISWGQFIVAGIVLLLLIGQLLMMRRFLRSPVTDAVWYSGFGVPLFVFGMMASAVAVRVFAAV